jgi:hypothetical protein
VRRRRIYSELLAPEILASRSTIDLLLRHRLEPIIALPPTRATEAMARALGALSAAGVRLGLWPLLSDADGYWPSNRNAPAFANRVRQCLAFASSANTRPSTVLIDLEPPLPTVRALSSGKLVRTLLGLSARALRAGREREEAESIFRGLRAELGARGIETFVTVFPPVIADLAIGANVWQSVLGTVAASSEWDVISPMLYTSLIAATLPDALGEARTMAVAKRSLELGARLLSRNTMDGRRSISLGLVGRGKLGNERTLTSPEDLATDIRIARQAGIDDLALFSLEGVLGSAHPEAWLEPFAS